MTRVAREVAAPERLWQGLERLARELGTTPEALVEQALHALLRFHGWRPAEPGSPEAATEPAGAAARTAATRRVLEAAADLEGRLDGGPAPGAGDPSPAGPAGATLRLHREAGGVVPVEKDRFLLGRGRHCDLVVDSARVSREHAVIRREADGWWIEDLGSSNGTWHRRERVDRRRIEDGDEYLVCSERIRCELA